MRVLFVCGHNAGRSLAAEALALRLRPDLSVASAGTTPSGSPNPQVLAALAEAGVPTDGLSSKGIDEVGGLAGWDLVVTMGCMDEGCPAIPPGVEHEDWGLPDPGDEPEEIPSILAEIRRRLATLPAPAEA